MTHLFDGRGEELWTVHEVAAALDYTDGYIRDRAEAGVLPSIKIGDDLYFSKGALEQWFLNLRVTIGSRNEPDDVVE